MIYDNAKRADQAKTTPKAPGNPPIPFPLVTLLPCCPDPYTVTNRAIQVQGKGKGGIRRHIINYNLVYEL